MIGIKKPRLRDQILKRLLVYCFTFFLFWPAISLFSAAVDQNKFKAIHVPISISFVAATGGTLVLMPDFIYVGIILMVPCLIFFSLLSSKGMLQPLDHRLSFCLEPILLFMSCFFALLLYYPILLHYPLLSPIRPLPVWLATIVIGVIVLACSALYASQGSRVKVSLSIVMVGLILVSFSEFCNSYRGRNYSLNKTSAIVLLGLDSLSYSDDLSIISNWAQSHQGTVYQQAITPGLLTNSVWTSLITMQPVDRHGVFHAFQSNYPENGGTLVDAARKAGYLTISSFPDQFSCWIASETDFDVHRDGPIGWRQIATSCVENASVLLPLIRPILPKMPLSAVPRNHIGTFNYDLEREFDDIFSHTGKTFIASHDTYLHASRYPKYSELSHDEMLQVLKAKTGEIDDKTLDWQYSASPHDPIQTRKWKVAHLQKALIASLERTGFLNHGGRLVIFSDHGNRNGLNNSNFTRPQYHHVLFITFGLPVYSDPNQPVSLLDIPGIIGFKKYRKSPAVVEFTLSRPNEWVQLIKTAKLNWDGTVQLDNELLAHVFKRLKSYDLSQKKITKNFPLKPKHF
jgi:hypothetical protein